MRRKRLRAAAALAALLLVGSWAILKWVLVPYRIRGGSMAPALMGAEEGENPSPGDIVLVHRLGFLLHGPARWDIAVVRQDGGEESVKRVAGLPGEAVEIREGKLHVDGAPVEPPAHLASGYIVAKGPHGLTPVNLGPDEYFLLGDSSYLSKDSRRLGPVKADRLGGKVLWILFPLARFGRVP